MEFENKGMAANMLSDEITGISCELKKAKFIMDEIIDDTLETDNIHPDHIVGVIISYQDMLQRLDILNDYLFNALKRSQKLDTILDEYLNAQCNKDAPEGVATAENDLDAELLELLQAAADNDGLVSSKKLLALSRRLKNKEDCDV